MFHLKFFFFHIVKSLTSVGLLIFISMKLFIKKLLRESLIKESPQVGRINDIEDDDLYDSLIA